MKRTYRVYHKDSLFRGNWFEAESNKEARYMYYLQLCDVVDGVKYIDIRANLSTPKQSK